MYRVKNFLIFIAIVTFSVSVFAQSNNDAAQAFIDLDTYFIQQYGGLAHFIGHHTRPLLVVDGFKYQLYLKNGSVKTFTGLIAPFNELKAISHIGPTLYAIAYPSWQNPTDTSWKQKLIELETKIKIARLNINNINWENSSWPGESEHLKKFMDDSLKMIGRFMVRLLEKNSFTQQDYQEFSTHYMHTMLASMYLANVLNTVATIHQLQQWKQELGQEQWDHLYIIMMGTKGRTTAELTTETNTAAITIASLMKPDNIKSHIFIMPMATSLDQAETTLGEILASSDLAHATFTTKRAKKAMGIYQAMLTPDIPLARDNVKRIAATIVNNGKVNLPKIGLLPKDEGY
ncbi:MAG: hypothetical protein A3F42_08330 [Gammaproteobacteria bacterium RIFCSPHIGHO2_12_FULL_37_34]|nr:MAG: hypothetical protein A3F42_08330 [Gammaproteobacteria bacterium RIFCSPHIGHO2_12_FULL_37_34]